MRKSLIKEKKLKEFLKNNKIGNFICYKNEIKGKKYFKTTKKNKNKIMPCSNLIIANHKDYFLKTQLEYNGIQNKTS